MSYRSRVYRHRNPHSHDEGAKEPFFSKQNDINKPEQRSTFFQAKLSVNEPGDKYEREADSVANAVVNNKVSLPDVQQKKISSIQRLSTSKEDEKLSTNDARMERDKEIQRMPIQKMSADPEKEKKKNIQKMDDPLKKEKDKKKTSVVQTKHDTSSNAAPANVSSKIGNSSGNGNQLPRKTLHEMNSSFGVDFSDVKVHNGSDAINMNKELQAQAFTHGCDIYFNEGKYNPENSEGEFLLAHELTHVVQQGKANDSNTGGISKKVIQAKPSSSCAANPDCPSDFCTPSFSKTLAMAERQIAAPILLAGIGAKISPRVVPLWSQYLFGGASPQDLSSSFGSDFTNSQTTLKTTKFLLKSLRSDLEKNPPAFQSGINRVVVNLPGRIGPSISEIDDPSDTNVMDFNFIGEIPGNIAGGVGKNQASCPVGATPSPFNDSREASGTAVVILNPDGVSLTVLPLMTFNVKDTIDLCPGNCGSDLGVINEQRATIPMSQFEASGISGDVPFEVSFPAPFISFQVIPKVPITIIPAPKPSPPPSSNLPAKVKVRAKPHLRIRESPDASSAILGNYTDGKEITILCVTDGEDVFGNKKWGKTDLGFVSDFYLNHLDTNTPPSC
ncbi:MAG: DUF4157 domain-containing protein [Ginsengibacter sp.]